MRFLADQDISKITVGLSKECGHKVVTAADIGMARAIIVFHAVRKMGY